VYLPGSPALRRDRAAVAELAASGLQARDLHLDVVSVAPVSVSGRQVRLRVRDVLPDYQLVDGSGVVVAEGAGRGPVRWTVTLRRVDTGWRVYDVERG